MTVVAESRIPVDLMNPGQVFACLGFMEAAETLLRGAMATFSWERSSPTATFTLVADGEEAPVQHVLRFLSEAEVVMQMPYGSRQSTEKWKIKTEISPSGGTFPFSAPAGLDTLPAIIRDSRGREIAIDHWGDQTKRDNVKFWAGSGGLPGGARLKRAIQLFRKEAAHVAARPFCFSAPQTSSFRFDWRRDYIPLEAGFSANKHNATIVPVGFPIVEVMATIGLSHSRPCRPARRDKLSYRYGVIGGSKPLDPIFIRAALGAVVSPVPGRPFRKFSMRLGWPGKVDQERCIIGVAELTVEDGFDEYVE